MGAIDQENLIRAAVAWIGENSPGARSAKAEVTARTPLLRDGVLDSLGLVDLVAFLEKTTGNQIDFLEFDEEELTTLGGLCRAVSGSGPAATTGGSAG